MPNIVPLKFNDPAPDFLLSDTHGKPVQLSSLWKDRALILAFTRHFGCPQCKELVDQLVKASPKLVEKNLRRAIVAQGTVADARVFCEERAPGILCLADPDRKAYRAYGLERVSVWQSFLSVQVWRSNRRLKREKGWRTELPGAGQDALQMAGTFVIATNGHIHLPYYYDHIADHPPVDLLLHGVMGMDWNQTFEGPVTSS